MSFLKWNDKARGFFDDKTKNYTKRVTSAHWCKKYKTFGGLQAEIIEKLKELGCKTVTIEYKHKDGTINTYVTDFDNYSNHGKAAVLNIQDGKQIFLAWDFFTYLEDQEKNKSLRTLDDF